MPRVLVTLATGVVLVQLPSGRLAVLLPTREASPVEAHALREELHWLAELEQRHAQEPPAPTNNAASPMPRGRPPAVTKDELRAHIVAHPGLSDTSRARMLSAPGRRPVSRHIVARLRRELDATD
jgi:hypothetical protein